MLLRIITSQIFKIQKRIKNFTFISNVFNWLKLFFCNYFNIKLKLYFYNKNNIINNFKICFNIIMINKFINLKKIEKIETKIINGLYELS